ncbi:MAG: ABC transporter ATP-binding protein [Desulfovibrionaceae bacterium]|nr:ABC transporter ATP-binding protein [Desulfovibrionaceae bacterium]MBF0514573.1 ABC transporter ATP-binding protein [Desulfovibrionaceae bacterium]
MIQCVHPLRLRCVMLELIDIRVRLQSKAGAVNILRGTTVAAQAGQSVAVTGRSGSGKTTLLMVAAGLLRPDSGRVLALGEDLTRKSEDELAAFRRRRVGVVFQSFHLLPNMTALENAALPLEFAGRADALDAAGAALARLGLGERLHHYPGELSGGEQQRAAIARAFAASPSIILADEPTGNLDSATGADVADTLFSLCAEKNTCLLLVTHDASLAARCDRRVVLADGLVVEAAG